MRSQVTVRPDGHQVILIHFVTRTEDGAERIACLPNLEQLASTHEREMPVHRTQETQGVTCTLCHDTPEYQQVAEANRLLALRRKSR